MSSNNFIWQLMSRCLSGEASAEEVALFEEVLKKDESLQQRYQILKQFWSCAHSFSISEDEKNKKQINTILKKAYEADILNTDLTKSKIFKHENFFKILISSAAAIIVLVTGFFLINKKSSPNTVLQVHEKNLQQVVAQKGSRNRTILPDGSVVWLNAGSSLSYTGNFKGLIREVYLKGEGFFDVVKQEGHPFIVHANGIDIKVLGTAFDVKSYSEDNTVEATLIRGLIQVTRQGEKNQKPVFLHPNEKLIVDLTQNIPSEKIKAVNVPVTLPEIKIYHLDSTIKTENIIETSWVYNRLEFRGDSFEELAKKLERWYNVKIIFEDEAVKHLSFHGSFENETVNQAFAALKAAVPFDYTINDQEVSIKTAASKIKTMK
ncbi:MAG: FecR family protein [Parafilimonas sp.]